MTKFTFHHDSSKLPDYNDSCHPVLMYDKTTWHSTKSSAIARTVIDKIRDLGVPVSIQAFDLVTIAMAVTAADSFSKRESSSNSWSRDLYLDIPLKKPELWLPVKNKLEKALNYLTGDQWKLCFLEGGLAAPKPKTSRKAKLKKKGLKSINSVCLFSGGLDSAVGAIDLINKVQKDKPLLVSHAYKGDATKQNNVESLLSGIYSRFSFNADPHIIDCLSGNIDITMRGRSFNFIAMAIAGASALQKFNQQGILTLFIPENGYISLNPPLTSRRIGSLSTRTTHPFFLSQIQAILNELSFDVQLKNPYQMKTKGQMLSNCIDQKALALVIPHTVSCSNWHRKGIQCGRCVPCIIRRASIFQSGFKNDAKYDDEKLSAVMRDESKRDDIIALSTAILRLNREKKLKKWVRQSGPLPENPACREELTIVFEQGLNEVRNFLKSESVI